MIHTAAVICLAAGLSACGARNAPTYTYGEDETQFRYAPLYE